MIANASAAPRNRAAPIGEGLPGCDRASPAVEAALFQHRAQKLYMEMDSRLKAGFPGKGDALCRHWTSVATLAGMAMRQQPISYEDVLLTLGMATSWIGVVIDSVDGDARASELALAIGSALANATLFLASDVRPSTDEIGALFQQLADEAGTVRADAESRQS